jgi:hypothetical protein
MCADTYGQAIYRLLDQVDPKDLEEVFADFIVPASGEAAVPADVQPTAPRPPLLERPQLPSEPRALAVP